MPCWRRSRSSFSIALLIFAAVRALASRFSSRCSTCVKRKEKRRVRCQRSRECQLISKKKKKKKEVFTTNNNYNWKTWLKQRKEKKECEWRINSRQPQGRKRKTHSSVDGYNLALLLEPQLTHANEILCDLGETLLALVNRVFRPVYQVVVDLLQGLCVCLVVWW